MTAAYLDTSALVAIAFGETGSPSLAKRLSQFDEILSSNFLEAEYRAALAREGVAAGFEMLTWISWILPNRPLGTEIKRVLDAGYLRGADLWHLACALYVSENPEELAFASLDGRQRDVAESLGFVVLG